MEHKDFDVQEEIRLAAESIFSALYHEGEMTLDTLQERVNWKSPIFDWALGWLVGKQDVEVKPRDSSFVLRRAAPAPAVFPLRGD